MLLALVGVVDAVAVKQGMQSSGLCWEGRTKSGKQPGGREMDATSQKRRATVGQFAEREREKWMLESGSVRKERTLSSILFPA